ncbi:hypothetical protein LT493_24140 [Streptomyces tricolor]|nr:hypothetical protein [Streptomyces tricolor]
MIVGACVERGADASVCGPQVLAGLAETLDGAREASERWEATGGGEFPDPRRREGAPGPLRPGRAGRRRRPADAAPVGDGLRRHAQPRRRPHHAQHRHARPPVPTLRAVGGGHRARLPRLAYALLVLDDEPRSCCTAPPAPATPCA